MKEVSIFDSETVLPDDRLTAKAGTLIGFEGRFARVQSHLRLLLGISELSAWNKKHHGGKLSLVDLVADQYAFAVFYGDVGTGKTATAECIANRLVSEASAEDSVLFKLSNRVRGSGMVGEMGSLLSDAFVRVAQAAGKGRRAILVIDEGDSLATARSQKHSHHEDKVAVNTVIQGIDDLRRFRGRVVTILCTNRIAVLDPALVRRAAVIEEFKRPTPEERHRLFEMDLGALHLSQKQIALLVDATGSRNGSPDWTYSDIRTRLYPAALAIVFPNQPLEFDHLQAVATDLKPSPVVEDN